MRQLIFAAVAALALGTAAAPALAESGRGYNPSDYPQVETQQSSAALVPMGGGNHGTIQSAASLPPGFYDHSPEMLAAKIRNNWYAAQAQQQNLARQGNQVPNG